MFGLFSKDYAKGAREIGSAQLRGSLEEAVHPWGGIAHAVRTIAQDWLWLDDSYLLLTERNARRFAYNEHWSRGQRIYRKEAYDCDDFTRAWLADMGKAAAKNGMERPPALGPIDFFPAGSFGIDESRHMAGWVAFQAPQGGVGFWIYEPQNGNFYHPKERVKETILAYG